MNNSRFSYNESHKIQKWAVEPAPDNYQLKASTCVGLVALFFLCAALKRYAQNIGQAFFENAWPWRVAVLWPIVFRS